MPVVGLGTGRRTEVVRPKVLCVDDEPQVLEGLALHLRRRCQVIMATGGAEALCLLDADPTVSVVISDMRMPGMDGAAFLAKCRGLAPAATRVLLTGQAELSQVLSVVNEGQIFQFLTKPCPPPRLLAVVEAAIRQHQLITAEKVLLEQTLRGSIQALVDVLGLTNPIAFGRAARVKVLAAELAEQVALPERWQVEVAAMLSQLGAIALPHDLVEKLYYGHVLTEAETAMVARMPALTEQLLAHIPRLETVRELLARLGRPSLLTVSEDTQEDWLRLASGVLRLATDFDALEAQGNAASFAVDTLRGRGERYRQTVLDALARVRGAVHARQTVRDVPIAGLKVGMILADDLKLASGALFVGRGFEVTTSLIERARNFRPGTLKEPLRVIVSEKKGA
jgi:CheY-like chemotaxis protein